MKHKFNIIFLLGGQSAAFLLMSKSEYFFLVVFIILLIFFVFLTIGVLNLRMNYFLKAINKTSSNEVLLTFDDGPDPETTPHILETLNEYGVKSIFFIIGAKAEKYPDIVQRIIQNGHTIGNHTYSHSNFFSLSSTEKVRKEISKTNDIIINYTGNENKLFRPPIGYTNPIIARVVYSMGLNVIGWNKRSYDTVITDTAMLTKRLLNLSKPGSIILLHDNLKQTVETLPFFLSAAKKNGTIFVNEKSIKSSLT